MADDPAASLRLDHNLPQECLALLHEGRAVIHAEKRERELREEAAAGARRALLATNTKTAAENLVQLCPPAIRLMSFARAVENDGNYQLPPDFVGMQFDFTIPGFLPLRVWVRRTLVAVETAPRYEWSPWELGQWGVVFAPNGTPVPHASLGLAVARAREAWLKANGQ